jgi:hypothetical protein
MHTPPPVNQAHPSPSPVEPPAGVPVVAPRSARRATARRASTRRATARRRKDDVEQRIRRHRQHHPHSTIGDMAKALDTDRATIAAALPRMLRAGARPTEGESA